MPDLPGTALLILDALAVFRLTHFVTTDTIPIGALRDRILERRPDSHLAEWFACPWCSSIPCAVLV
ncbi:MAG: hypothetical protein ACRDTT_03595, partial [Pseudonocardiaceae bacterium]